MQRLREERGGDSILFIVFVIPFMVTMTFVLVDLGNYFSVKYAVTNILRDSARGVAAYGSDTAPSFAPNPGQRFSTIARNRMVSGGKCVYGPCTTTSINVVCGAVNGNQVTSANVTAVGQQVGCTVTNYPYKSLAGAGLLGSSWGLGFGAVIKPFTVTVTTVAEVGPNPNLN